MYILLLLLQSMKHQIYNEQLLSLWNKKFMHNMQNTHTHAVSLALYLYIYSFISQCFKKNFYILIFQYHIFIQQTVISNIYNVLLYYYWKISLLQKKQKKRKRNAFVKEGAESFLLALISSPLSESYNSIILIYILSIFFSFLIFYIQIHVHYYRHLNKFFLFKKNTTSNPIIFLFINYCFIYHSNSSGTGHPTKMTV